MSSSSVQIRLHFAAGQLNFLSAQLLYGCKPRGVKSPILLHISMSHLARNEVFCIDNIFLLAINLSIKLPVVVLINIFVPCWVKDEASAIGIGLSLLIVQ